VYPLFQDLLPYFLAKALSLPTIGRLAPCGGSGVAFGVAAGCAPDDLRTAGVGIPAVGRRCGIIKSYVRRQLAGCRYPGLVVMDHLQLNPVLSVVEPR